MRLSKYNKIFKIDDKVNCLHNSISGAFLFFDNNDLWFADEKVQIDKLNINLLNLFKSKMFLVEDSFDEFYILHNKFLDGIKDESFVRITIVPTLSCNLKCKYCFVNSDNNINKNISFKEYIVLQTWLKTIILNKNTKKIFINFYGGEPILEIERIYNLMSFISMLCKNNNKLYAFHVYTNGLLLKKDMIYYLFNYGMTGIQISLDKERIINEEHLDKFLSTLEECVSLKLKLEITVRINIDSTFSSFLPKLFIKNKFKKLIKQVSFYFAPIFEKHGYQVPKNKTSEITSYSEILANAIKFSFSKYNFDFTQLPHFRKFPCYTQCKNAYVVGPDLNFYSCHSHVAIPNLAIGNIVTCKSNIPLYDPFLDKTCSCCRLLPICMGECYMRYININKQRKHYNMTEQLVNEMLIVKHKILFT